jgi:hypothetical protein
MLQMPTTQLTDYSTIYVTEPDIPAGTTIADYRLSRPRPVAWWRRRTLRVAASAESAHGGLERQVLAAA